MSAQNDIHTYLASRSNGDAVMMTPNEIASAMGVERDAVNKTFFNLNRSHKIEVMRAENGRSIIGFKVLEAPGDAKREQRLPRALERERQHEPVKVEASSPAPARRRSILTPNLDAYAEAKARFERMSQDMGDLIEATFRGNRYAEEGLAALARMRVLEDQYIAARRELDEREREVRGLRSALEEKVRIKANGAGVTVQHGD